MVYKDADLVYTARRIAEGARWSTQVRAASVCSVYVHDEIYDTCLAMILDHMRSFVVGDPRMPETDVGPMISETEAVKTKEKIKQAIIGERAFWSAAYVTVRCFIRRFWNAPHPR
ncbi:MAG: aldehyde dehydrogenase family protein [Methanocorpusculum sp.]|nr:aldehyde dehydrogenase family protein [Methanocorpusculum sp.]